MVRTPLIALSLALAASSASADIRPVLGFTTTSGGQTLATVRYSDGSSQNIKSGGLVHLYGGFEWQSAGSPFALQANIGLHVDDTNAKNGSVKFQRYPLELIALWQTGSDWRFGAGLRKSSNVKLTSSGAANGFGDYKLSAKAGALVQGEYLFGTHGAGSLYLRWVREDYTINARKVDGNHLGLGVSYRF